MNILTLHDTIVAWSYDGKDSFIPEGTKYTVVQEGVLAGCDYGIDGCFVRFEDRDGKYFVAYWQLEDA